MLTDTDRARLDAWWEEWFNQTGMPTTPAAMRRWYNALTPAERTYIDGKIAALQLGMTTLAGSLTAWWVQMIATVQPAFAQLSQVLVALHHAVNQPPPLPDRSAWAVHKPRTRR